MSAPQVLDFCIRPGLVTLAPNTRYVVSVSTDASNRTFSLVEMVSQAVIMRNTDGSLYIIGPDDFATAAQGAKADTALQNSAAFATSSQGTKADTAIQPAGTYSNPAWITTLAWSKISTSPTTLSGYGITDSYPLSGNPSSFLTGVTSGQITTALGFTPYNATNPSSFIAVAGARTAIALTTTGTSGAATYNNSTGALNIPQYANSGGTVTSVTAGTGLSGGAITGSGTIAVLTSQNIATLNNLTTNGFVKTGGAAGTLSVDTSTYLTANQSITFTGDAAGSGTTSVALTLATVASAGTYSGVTVNVKGLVTDGTTRSWNNAPGRSLITTAAAANGFQVSSTRDAGVCYSVTVTTTATIGGASTGRVLLEIAATNSATAGDWTEVARFENGQTITLAVALQSIQTGAGVISGRVPAGYYARLRQVSVSGSPTFAVNSGQEVLL